MNTFRKMIKLKEKRKEHKLTQTELGEKVGVTLCTIFNYESGKRTPNLEMLKKLAAALECSVDDII